MRQVLQVVFTNSRREISGQLFPPNAPRDQVESILNGWLNLRSASNGGRSFLRSQFERPLWILALVVCLLLLIACLLLTLVAAALPPTIRAARMDPMDALRYERDRSLLRLFIKSRHWKEMRPEAEAIGLHVFFEIEASPIRTKHLPI